MVTWKIHATLIHLLRGIKVALLRICSPQVNGKVFQQRLSFLGRDKITHVESPSGRSQNTAKLNAALQGAKRIIERLVSFFACSPQSAGSAMIMFKAPPQTATRIS